LSVGIADRQALDRYFMLAPMVWKAPEKLGKPVDCPMIVVTFDQGLLPIHCHGHGMPNALRSDFSRNRPVILQLIVLASIRAPAPQE
jgi:hypothetical protein